VIFVVLPSFTVGNELKLLDGVVGGLAGGLVETLACLPNHLLPILEGLLTGISNGTLLKALLGDIAVLLGPILAAVTTIVSILTPKL